MHSDNSSLPLPLALPSPFSSQLPLGFLSPHCFLYLSSSQLSSFSSPSRLPFPFASHIFLYLSSSQLPPFSLVFLHPLPFSSVVTGSISLYEWASFMCIREGGAVASVWLTIPWPPATGIRELQCGFSFLLLLYPKSGHIFVRVLGGFGNIKVTLSPGKCLSFANHPLWPETLKTECEESTYETACVTSEVEQRSSNS